MKLISPRLSRLQWLLPGTTIFLVTLLIFLVSPNRQIIDSKFTLLLSQSLLEDASFSIKGYDIPMLERENKIHGQANLYQLEWANQDLYYYFPPGSAVLSVPLVAVAKALRVAPANGEGIYVFKNERELQSVVAALLMAALAVLLFSLGRLLLPTAWSALIALASVLGTQIWSTASRGLWSETWGLLLLGIALYLLVKLELGKSQVNPLLLATVLAWMYFVRPTNAVTIAAMSVYIFVYHRNLALRFIITGALWFVGFLIYSWQHFGRLLPRYYDADRLSTGSFWVGLAGNLISPSRGLLIFVPVVLFVGYLLVAYWKHLSPRRLVVLSLAAVIGHLLVISLFYPWYGGGCYGPRYSAGSIPWFTLLAALGVKAKLRADDHKVQSPATRRGAWMAGGLLLAASIFINARGAISPATYQWNNVPFNIDQKPDRIWDWKYPQFLAGLISPPLPAEFPLLAGRVNLLLPESQKFLWYGWSIPQETFRWTYQSEVGLVFGMNEIADLHTQLKLSPFLAPGILDRQRLTIKVNDTTVARYELRTQESKVYSFVIPRHILREKNTIVMQLPDAASPENLGVGLDGRELGVTMEWIEVSKVGSEGDK